MAHVRRLGCKQEEFSLDKPKYDTNRHSFGVFSPSEIPRRPLFGYERQLKAGLGIGLTIFDNGNADLLAFGLPGTGKGLFPCALAHKFNDALNMGFYLAYIRCDHLELFDESDLVEKLSGFIEILKKKTPVILHLVQLDAIGKPLSSHNDVNNHESFGIARIARLLRSLVSYTLEKTFLISTADYPDRIDEAFLSRFSNVFYFEPTNKDVIAEIIASLLHRKDSNEITRLFLEYALGFDLIPMSGKVIRACRLIQKKTENINRLETEDVVNLLRRFVSPNTSTDRISLYEKNNQAFIGMSKRQIDFWRKHYSMREIETKTGA